MMDRRDAYRILVRKPDGKVPHGKSRRRWKSDIRMDMKSVYRTWTGLIWRRIGTVAGFVTTVMKNRVKKYGEYLE
jgi:hypothetical protein